MTRNNTAVPAATSSASASERRLKFMDSPQLCCRVLAPHPACYPEGVSVVFCHGVVAGAFAALGFGLFSPSRSSQLYSVDLEQSTSLAMAGELKQKASKFHRFLALPYPLMRVLLIFSQTGIGLPIENTVSRTISENPKALILRVCS